MKYLPVVILLMVAALVSTVTGCQGEARYDARLTVADSLLTSNPDSTLALVEALAPADLATSGDRAYRDLLVTQARYKCYITATSDSDINRALGYYRAHSGDQEKLTRAYIYKGAVMEELGYPDSAMFYYKHAEATAAPDDYFNLGYTKMRMGALYRDNMDMGSKDILKFEEALACFQHIPAVHYQLICMTSLGSLYCLKYPHKADSLLSISLTLAEQERDSIIFVDAAQNLMKMYISQKRYEASHDILLKIMKMEKVQYPATFFMYAAMTYSHLNKLDSAQMFIDIIKGHPISSAIDKLAYLETLRDMALARGNDHEFKELDSRCKRFSDSLMVLDTPIGILKTENDINKQSEHEFLTKQKTANKWKKALCCILGLLTMVLIVCFWRLKQKKHQKRQIQQRLDSALTQVEELKLLQANLQSHNINDNILKEILDSNIKMLKDVIEESYHFGNNHNSKKIREIVQFQSDNHDKWTKLFGYLDMEFGNIISQTKSNYPNLSDKDLLLMAMVALDFSYIQMAMVLGYNNATTMSSMKQRLANKMGLGYSLNEYIKQFKPV